MIGAPGYTWRKTTRKHDEPTYRMYSGGDRVASVDHNSDQNFWTWRSEQYSWLSQSPPYATSDEAKIACAAAHREAVKLGLAPDLEDDGPPDPELQKILDEYIELRKANAPSEETVRVTFAAAGERCECAGQCLDHEERCDRTLDWRDHGDATYASYTQWLPVLKAGSETEYEIVCQPCKRGRYQAERKQRKAT